MDKVFWKKLKSKHREVVYFITLRIFAKTSNPSEFEKSIMILNKSDV